MSAQLLDVGERVDVVVLLDAHPSLAPPPGADRLLQVRANLAKYGPLRLLPWARRQIGWKLGKRPDPDMLRAMGCLEPERLGYVDVEAALFAIGRAHQLRTVDVDVVLVKARELWPMYADDYGWSHWVRGTIQIEESPGDHLTLLRPSHVAALAEILRRTFR